MVDSQRGRAELARTISYPTKREWNNCFIENAHTISRNNSLLNAVTSLSKLSMLHRVDIESALAVHEIMNEKARRTFNTLDSRFSLLNNLEKSQ